MYRPRNDWDARKYEFRELVADDERLIELMKQMRDHFPDAFQALVRQLDKDWDARVVEEQSGIAPSIANLENGELEPPIEEPQG